ncbi:MAG: hypothetical protein PVH87_00035 [Desulfobacteraceae bacterium]|jgi:hypothetical protein
MLQPKPQAPEGLAHKKESPAIVVTLLNKLLVMASAKAIKGNWPDASDQLFYNLLHVASRGPYVKRQLRILPQTERSRDDLYISSAVDFSLDKESAELA